MDGSLDAAFLAAVLAEYDASSVGFSAVGLSPTSFDPTATIAAAVSRTSFEDELDAGTAAAGSGVAAAGCATASAWAATASSSFSCNSFSIVSRRIRSYPAAESAFLRSRIASMYAGAVVASAHIA